MRLEGMLALCVLALSLTSSSLAWSNGGYSLTPYHPDYGTHDWIAEHALDWLPQEAKGWIASNMAWYLYGTELPDNGQAPDGIGDTAFHHIYFDSSGRLTDASAAARARAMYIQALERLLAGNYAEAAKYAGAMTHYIADVAVFSHVMGSGTDWGEESHHGDYEIYVNSKTSSYSAPFNSFLSFDGELRLVSAYNAAVELAYDTTFDGLGRGLTCVWMDENYDWLNQTFLARAGESLNLAVNYVADVLYTLYVDYTLRQQPTTATVTFSAEGLESDAAGTLLKVDGVDYRLSDLPKSFTWSVGSTHSFEWMATVESSHPDKRYAWSSSSGASTSRSGVIVVQLGGASVMASYKAQYRWLFSASGLGGDASEAALTVDGVAYSPPAWFWWDNGSSHTYAYREVVGSASSGRRYACHSPPSGLVVVSEPKSISPPYHVEHQLAISVNPMGAGATDPAVGVHWLDLDSSVNVSAAPSAGYVFDRWLLDGVELGRSGSTSLVMDSPHSLTAAFKRAAYTLTVHVYLNGTLLGAPGARVRVDGETYAVGSDGKVNVTVQAGLHTVEVDSPFTVNSGTRYIFTGWGDSAAAASRTLTVMGDVELVAYVKRQHMLSIRVDPPTGGSASASPESPGQFYDEGVTVTLSAIPSLGYAFDCWAGDASGSTSRIQLSISSPVNVTACFFSFSISTSPPDVTLRQGGEVVVNVTVAYRGGLNPKIVEFSALGLPSGVKAHFKPGSVTVGPSSPTATSLLVISASASTPRGVYPVAVVGISDGLVGPAALSMRVLESEMKWLEWPWLLLIAIALVLVAVLLLSWVRSRRAG
ncbi:MAG: zinc dependent phospholipase C family protein [Candidatus Nezhaarchaeota archaeon]|nr:zinc dependent phospholipase C family protein [Candidatus Nezhaarchaeota archaeon]